MAQAKKIKLDKREEANYNQLKDISFGLGASVFGVADIKEAKHKFAISSNLINKFDKAISLGARLSESLLEEIDDQPTKTYYYHYRTVNALLDLIAVRITNFIQDQGYSAFPVPVSQILDWNTQKGQLSHKRVGVLAGIGWIGRNNLLVNEKLGSQFRITTILTDMPLILDKPVKFGCGTCKACVAACPAGAIKENPEDYDLNLCTEKLKDFTRKHIVEQFVCGVCVNACRGKNK